MEITLAIVTNYNDRICCALDIVGMSHLGTFLKNIESYRRDLRRVEYGDERDPDVAAFFERTAALNNAQKITKPLFVVQGANDPRVPRTEAEQIVTKVKQNGGPVWFLMAMDEGHGIAKKGQRGLPVLRDHPFRKAIPPQRSGGARSVKHPPVLEVRRSLLPSER